MAAVYMDRAISSPSPTHEALGGLKVTPAGRPQREVLVSVTAHDLARTAARITSEFAVEQMLKEALNPTRVRGWTSDHEETLDRVER